MVAGGGEVAVPTFDVPTGDAVFKGGKIDAKAMEAIRGGWYLGEQGFKDKRLVCDDN